MAAAALPLGLAAAFAPRREVVGGAAEALESPSSEPPFADTLSLCALIEGLGKAAAALGGGEAGEKQEKE